MTTIEMTANLFTFIERLKTYLNDLDASELAEMVTDYVQDTFDDQAFEYIENLSKAEINRFAMQQALDLEEAFDF